MAKPDMPYALFPWLVPPAATPSGALTADLGAVFKWYWRVRAWTATMTGSFSASFSMSDGSTIGVAFGMSAVETFDVLGSGLDELALAIPLQDSGPAPYRWILRGSASVSGGVTVTDSLGYASGTYSGTYSGDDGGTPTTARTLFAPGRSYPFYSDGYHHMTRDPSSGLFTPFLGGYGPPLWIGGAWGDLVAPGLDFGGNCRINATRLWSDSASGSTRTGSQAITVAGSVDGHSFSCGGFVQWTGAGGASEVDSRTISSVTYGGDGAISLVISPATPGGYWTYAPRIDPGNPTYDATTGAIATNPATGAPWTIAEIIARHGP